VTKHPLNDVMPLGFSNRETDMFRDLVGTNKRLLYVSHILPIVVLHDSNSNQLEFTLLKENKESLEANQDEDAYLSSLVSSSRHKDMLLPSSICQLYLEPIWRITSTSAPDFILVTQCLIS